MGDHKSVVLRLFVSYGLCHDAPFLGLNVRTVESEQLTGGDIAKRSEAGEGVQQLFCGDAWCEAVGVLYEAMVPPVAMSRMRFLPMMRPPQ